jgi:GNAT superfamily N-acetyltransferase
VGLADAFTWARSYDELSDGQRARFDLAWLIFQQADLICIDEWLAKLDRITARAVAWTTQRALRSFGVAAILVTSHDDLLHDLSPDVHIKMGWTDEPAVDYAVAGRPTSTLLADITYERGTAADWAQLKHLHYAAGDPATCHSYHVLRHPDLAQPAAVALLSYPDLHSAGRNHATRDAYLLGQDKSAITRLNREVLKLSRIVVTPELRGIGLARMLITNIIANVGVRWIECVTAMGRYSGFLGSIGFTNIPQAAGPEEGELLDFCEAENMPAHAALVAEDFLTWLDSLPVRRRRRGRRLVWLYYHHFVLHRRNHKQKPGCIPGRNDPRWPAAADLVTRRVHERPSYWIIGPIDPLTGVPDADEIDQIPAA